MKSPTESRALSAPDHLALRAGLASIWLTTGALVLHPHYREVGAQYLEPLGLGEWIMWVTCAAEIGLGLWVLLRPMRTWLAVLQGGMIATFTLTLAVTEPMLLAHPLGVLSKNLPVLALIVVLWLVEVEGWTERGERLLRFGVASVWFTEGIVPKVLVQQPWELEFVTRLGLPGDPGVVLAVVGLLQAASGVAALTLTGRPLRVVLGLQLAALVTLPALVALLEPLWLVHPFGPLTKNLPVLAGTAVVYRCSSRS